VISGDEFGQHPASRNLVVRLTFIYAARSIVIIRWSPCRPEPGRSQSTQHSSGLWPGLSCHGNISRKSVIRSTGMRQEVDIRYVVTSLTRPSRLRGRCGRTIPDSGPTAPRGRRDGLAKLWTNPSVSGALFESRCNQPGSG